MIDAQSRSTRPHPPRRGLLIAAFTLSFVLGTAGLATATELDRGFGHGGRVVHDFGGSDGAGATALTASGKILTAGSAVIGGKTTPVVARFHSDGSLDRSFGENGRTVIDVPAAEEANGIDLALGSDGIVVLADVRPDGGGRTFVFARLHRDGRLDEAFGDAGVSVAGGGFRIANAMALTADGRIVVAGYSGGDFQVSRFTADGEPDPSFSGDGTETTDFPSQGVGDQNIDWAAAVALAPDGDIVLAGQTGFDDGSGDADSFNEDVALARYLPNGGLDPSFSEDGLQTVGYVQAARFGGTDDIASEVAVLGDGSIVAAGGTHSYPHHDMTVFRFLSGGELDSSFATGGVRIIDFAGHEDFASGLAVTDAGRIAVAGQARTGRQQRSRDFALALLSPGGEFVHSFGSAGRTTTDFGGQDGAGDVAVTPRGGLVLVGSTHRPGASDTALARYR